MPKQPKISMKSFVEEGYLQEVNRQFLHILGLSMEVKKTGDKYEFDGVWDFREITGGIKFNDDAIITQNFIDKTNKIKEIMSENKSLRKQLYGKQMQQVPASLDNGDE